MTEAKLHFLETLIATDGARECAELAAGWLLAHAGAARVIVTVLEDGSRLRVLAGRGALGRAARDHVIDLEAPGEPLAAVVGRTQPAVVALDARHGLPRASYLAVPLHGLFLDEDAHGGVLLVSPVTPAVARAARWLADALGPRLTRAHTALALREAHRRLDSERALLHDVLNAAPDPILLTDIDGRMILANASAENLFASRGDESEGRRRAIALNNMLLSAAQSWAATAKPGAVRRELLLADPEEGSDLLFELLSTPLADSQQARGVVSILRDVTDLRRATQEIEDNYRRLRGAEASVRAERDRLNLLVDSVADPILVTDPQGRIVEMNAPAERLFVAPAATGEQAVRVQANDANLTSLVSHLLFAGGDQTRHRGPIGLVAPDTGAAVPFDAVAAKVLSEQGELIGVVTTLHDRTESVEKERLYEQVKRASDELEEKVRLATAELVRQNELLRRQQIQLEQASALKSQFLANMSHEFRTPLNAILGYTSMLLQGVSGPLSADQREDLERVDSNARTLMSIINDILDISRIEAGKVPLSLSDFVVPELVAEVLAELAPIVARSRLKVVTEMHVGATELHSDRQKVKQIVLNLLTNALKFTREGSICVRSWREPNGEFRLAVRDTGIGIAPEQHARVFEDFHQVDASTTREHGGTGLGLSISARLAAALGGRIDLESAPGLGSTFTLVLPKEPPR